MGWEPWNCPFEVQLDVLSLLGDVGRKKIFKITKGLWVKIHIKPSPKCLVYAGFLGFKNDCACRLALELASKPLVL